MKTTKLTLSLFLSNQNSATNKIRLGQAALKKFSLAVVLLLIYATGARAQGTFAYTNNETFVNNTVSGFAVGANGALTPIAGSPFPTGGGGFGGGGFFAANRVTVSTAGRFLYASNAASGSVTGFSINPATGFLTPVPGSPFLVDAFGSVQGYSLAVTPNNKFLYCANDAFGTLSVFSIGGNGSLTPVPGSLIILGQQPDGIKVSPDGRFLSASLVNVGLVAMFSIANNGALTAVPGSPFPASAPQVFPLVAGIDINCASNLLFAGIATSGPTVIDVFNIAPNGALSSIPGSPFTFGGQNSNIPFLSPNGRFLFVSNQYTSGFAGSITVLNVAANGSLTQVPGSPFANPGGSFPSGMATDASGKFLFAANDNPAISVFSIATNGVLSPVPGSPFFTGGSGDLSSVAVYPGKSCSAFDTCLRDNNTGDVFTFSSSTGAYQYTRCRDGLTISGTGALRNVSGVLTLTDSESDRRVSGGFFMGQRTGRVTIVFMLAPGIWQTFTVNDTTTFGAGCTCGQ
jgi:6-phosphogluconolactonase (cycloisomerase 2 family)